LFTYPEFFENEWMILMENQDGKRARRKSKSLDTNGEPNVLIMSPIKTTRERITLSNPGNTSESGPKSPVDEFMQITVAVVKNNVPPPPGPPPPMVFFINKVSKAPVPPPPPPVAPIATRLSLFNESPVNPNADTTQGANMDGFLTDIRSKQFVLKSTTPLSREEVKKANEPHGVAAILMRRAALEESDSDQGIFILIR
jgi:hypothetical protein